MELNLSMLVRIKLICALIAILLVPQFAMAQVAFPLKASANKRYLVDQNNVPFLIAGDSPQSMIGNLSVADAETFFQTRQAQGFNAVWINLLCADGTGCAPDGRTYDGVAPFTSVLPGLSAPNYDLRTPNEAYFAKVDQILNLAARYGFVVILNPAETISFLTPLKNNGTSACRTYGRYLGTRYAILLREPHDNVMTPAGAIGSRSGVPRAPANQVATGVFDNT